MRRRKWRSPSLPERVPRATRSAAVEDARVLHRGRGGANQNTACRVCTAIPGLGFLACPAPDVRQHAFACCARGGMRVSMRVQTTMHVGQGRGRARGGQQHVCNAM